jgi:hypothetical protein
MAEDKTVTVSFKMNLSFLNFFREFRVCTSDLHSANLCLTFLFGTNTIQMIIKSSPVILQYRLLTFLCLP